MPRSIEQLIASIASIFGTIGIAGVLFVAAWMVAKWLGRVGRPDLDAYGDWPAVPEEMRLPSKKAGERPRKAGEPVTGHVWGHDGGATIP